MLVGAAVPKGHRFAVGPSSHLLALSRGFGHPQRSQITPCTEVQATERSPRSLQSIIGA